MIETLADLLTILKTTQYKDDSEKFDHMRKILFAHSIKINYELIARVTEDTKQNTETPDITQTKSNKPMVLKPLKLLSIGIKEKPHRGKSGGAQLNNKTGLTDSELIEMYGKDSTFKGLLAEGVEHIRGNTSSNTASKFTVIEKKHNEKKPSGPTIDFQKYKIGRVCLTTLKNYNFTADLNFECNGVIMDFDTLEILVLPNRNINNHGNFRKFCDDVLAVRIPNIDEEKKPEQPETTTGPAFTVYEITDGSAINLYYHDGWKLSSRNGFDIGNYKWFTEHTYMDAFGELVRGLKGFDLGRLDKAHSYSFVFRHHAFHLYGGFGETIKLTRIYNRTTGEIVNLTKSNLEKLGIDGFPIQTPIKINLRDLRTYVYSLNKPQKEKPKINCAFGVIISGAYNEFGANSVFKIESPLMKFIRTSLYALDDSEKRWLRKFNYDRLEYITLRAYLNPVTNKQFIVAFPNLRDKYEMYKEIFTHVVNKLMYKFYSDNLPNVDNTESDNTRVENTRVDNTTIRYKHIERIDEFVKMIADTPGIKDILSSTTNKNRGTVRELISDYITDVKHIRDIYMCLLAKE